MHFEKEIRHMKYLLREIGNCGLGLTTFFQFVAPANPKTYFTHIAF